MSSPNKKWRGVVYQRSLWYIGYIGPPNYPVPIITPEWEYTCPVDITPCPLFNPRNIFCANPLCPYSEGYNALCR